MTIDTTKKIIIRVAIFAMLFLAIVLGILTPTLIGIKKTSQESYKLRVLLEEKYQKSLNSRITRKRMSEIKEAVANFDTLIFKSGDELKLITFFETLSSKHNLVQAIHSSNLDTVGNNRTANISLNLRGTYKNALQYIVELESAPYFINIQQLTLTPVFTKEGNASDEVNLNIATEIYVAK